MKSYFKFLSRNKLYTAIEAVGLIVSITFVILIGSYVWQQYRVAYENPDGNRIYAVGLQNYVALSWWDKAEFENGIPEAELVCRVSAREGDEVITIGEKKLKGSVTQVDKEFFDMFPNYILQEGSLDEYALKGHCLVSESFARENFDGNPIGQELSLSDYFFSSEQNYIISGVFKDFENTIMPPTDILTNPEFDPYYSSGKLRPFSNIGQYVTFIKAYKGTDREVLAQRVHDKCREHYDETVSASFPIYTVPELYFNEGQYVFKRGNKTVLQILSIVVLLLLVSAVFNYINLNLAMAGKRAKEMATRRLLGALQGNIVLKHICESVLFTAICFVLALLLAWALLPTMNEMLMNVSDVEDTWAFVPISLGLSAGNVCAYFATVVLLGVLAGIAPAMLASRFAPIDIVRGTFRRRSKMIFSKIFIVFQNVVSVLLIALAILMEVQFSHMVSRPLNARSEGLYYVKFYARDYEEVQPLIDRLKKIPQVKRVAYGSGFPGQMNMGYAFRRPDEGRAMAQIIICDEDYFDMMGLNVLKDFGTPRTGSVWMSRHLADEIDLNDSTALFYANTFHVNGASTQFVGGVFDDVPTADASASNPAVNSAVIIARSEDILYGNGLLVEVFGDEKAAAKAIMAAYADYYVERNGTYVKPAQSGYIQDVLKEQLRPVKTALRLVELFMLLAVLISLLGLVAMSTYFSGENTKQIAVRKVFGSNVRLETLRTVRSYMILVGIAIIIGIPMAVWASAKYLSRFAYRIENYGWVFVAAAIVSIAIAFASVLWQTLRAAQTNPATELKKE